MGIKEKIESAKTSDFLTEGLEEAEVKKIVQDSVITTKELEAVIHRLDVINSPYIALVNPVDKEKLLSAAPELEEKYVFCELPEISLGKAYVLDRNKMELSPIIDYKPFDCDMDEV